MAIFVLIRGALIIVYEYVVADVFPNDFYELRCFEKFALDSHRLLHRIRMVPHRTNGATARQELCGSYLFACRIVSRHGS